jgi:hypothetical protein
MSRGRRFFYVASKRSRTVHMADSITDGNRTWCGVMMRKWYWARRDDAKRRAKRANICKRCKQARSGR